MTILSKGPIINTATGFIASNGQSNSSGAGGGAGGFVILASLESVENYGKIQADGAKGGDSSMFTGPGGGGGGGIVHLLAPAIALGTVSVKGGDAGVPGAAGSVTSNPRGGGGAGGACGGAGGRGGSVHANGNPDVAVAGGDGYVITTHVDPTSLF